MAWRWLHSTSFVRFERGHLLVIRYSDNFIFVKENSSPTANFAGTLMFAQRTCPTSDQFAVAPGIAAMARPWPQAAGALRQSSHPAGSASTTILIILLPSVVAHRRYLAVLTAQVLSHLNDQTRVTGAPRHHDRLPNVPPRYF